MVMEGVGRRGKAVAVVKTAVKAKKKDVAGKPKKNDVSTGKKVDVVKLKAEMLRAKKEEIAKAREKGALVKRKKEEDEVKTLARAAKKARKEDAIVVPVDDRGKATMDRKKEAKDSSACPIAANNGDGAKQRRMDGEETEAVVAAVVANGGLTEGEEGETRNPALPVAEKGTRPASARQLVRKRGRDVDALMKEGVPFSVTLSKKEILEDLTRMAGHVPVKWRKVKRRNVWGPFNMLNLGKFLHLVSLEQYDPEKFL